MTNGKRGRMKVIWKVGILFGGCADETDYWVEARTPEAALRLGRRLARRHRSDMSAVVRVAPRIQQVVEVGSVDAR